MSSKKTVLVVGITADRMPNDESLCKQLKWTPGTEFDVKHIKSQEFFLGLKQLLQKYEPDLWERVSDADGRIERDAIQEAQEVALVDRHLEQFGSPAAYIVDSITRVAHVYPSNVVLDVAACRGLKVYMFHFGKLSPIK